MVERKDLIRELGAMTLASRLKRLGERLKTEATQVYQDHGIDFNDSWFLVAVALSRQKTASVSEIADILDVSHAAVSQMASAMESRGLVTSSPDPADRRRNLLQLTERGLGTVNALEPLWKAVGDCTEAMIIGTGLDLIAAITLMEEQLGERSLMERVSATVPQTEP